MKLLSWPLTKWIADKLLRLEHIPKHYLIKLKEMVHEDTRSATQERFHEEERQRWKFSLFFDENDFIC